jgi:hypothetical protein
MMLKKLMIVVLLAGLVNADDDFITKVTKSCDAGSSFSCANLAYMYHDGIDGARKDIFKAMELYGKACNLGSGSGCLSLGFAFEDGEGVRQDRFQAMEYYGKACDLKEEIGCKRYARIKNR